MRKVKVFKAEFNKGKFEKIDLGETGKFHQWAQDSHEFESGPGHFPVAIIEMIPSGEVRKIEPEYIQFIDVEQPRHRGGFGGPAWRQY